MQIFSELPISTYVKERLSSARFSTPTPIQAAAIPHALEGKDVLATAQTGTGKTLAFLIPVLEKLLRRSSPGIAALVLVPTRELAMQVVDQYNALRGKQLSPAALVVGGLSETQQLSVIRKGPGLVVATPGRLEDFLDRRLIHFRELQVLVLDEADRMLDMGFLPAIRRIAAVLPKERQTMCFSATMEGAMANLVKDYTRSPVRLAFGSTLKPVQSVRLQAFEVTADGKQQALHHLLTKEVGRCLVFSRTKRGTDRNRSAPRRWLASNRDGTACWWQRILLRAEFTCRTSPTSSTTICRKYRKTSSTGLAAPDVPADTACLLLYSPASSDPTCSNWSAR